MKRRLVLLSVVPLLALLAMATANVSAQADRNCEDFADQPAAQASLNSTYPDDPDGLDRDKDWIACEDFFGLTDEEAARVVPANLVNNAGQPTPEPTPGPSSEGTAPAPAAASASTGSRIEPPADLMAQVAACEVVAVSSRSIAAAGCPGVGSIVLRPAAGTPRMRSQVIIRPAAAFGPATDQGASAAQVARQDDALGKHIGEQRERPRKKRSGAGEKPTRTK